MGLEIKNLWAIQSPHERSLWLWCFIAGLTSACQPSTPPLPSPKPLVQHVEKPPSIERPKPEQRPDKPTPTALLIQPTSKDRGVFDHLNPKVNIKVPKWIHEDSYWVLRQDDDALLMIGKHPLALLHPTRAPKGLSGVLTEDRDQDGVPNRVDVIRGSHKVTLNGAAYKGGYIALPYPNGDVPHDQGVCTDVIVRVLRNAGLDLQKALHEDIQAHRSRYPMVRTKANPHIDHRRVRTLLPWFQHTMDTRDPIVSTSLGDWLPGDIVFMDTLPRSGPDHIGVVSDRIGESGYPLIVNNWTDGYTTSAMDLLSSIPVTHRFRWPSKAPQVAPHERGLSGLLKRAGLSIPKHTTQVVLVLASHWNHNVAVLRRFERRGERWHKVRGEVPVRLGSAGLGWGLGLHQTPPNPTILKREGDRRSPVGVFSLGTAFGRSAKIQGSTWPWRRVDIQDHFIDDPQSPDYNTWQRLSSNTPAPWSSAEPMSMYNLGIVVHHNTNKPIPERGSAIFLHDAPHSKTLQPTLGCTAVKTHALRSVISWLQTQAHPVLVQTQGVYFDD